MSYTTITIEGGLIPAEILEQIATGESQGQRPEDFGLDKNRRLLDAIAAAWTEAREAWIAAQQRGSESNVTLTRERWMRPLLAALGYNQLIYMPQATRVDNRTYAISHRAGADDSGPPVHIEGFGTDLDRRPPSGRPRLSPHALMQEYLNSHEHLWGIVANGDRLRLLRDASQISRPRYVEFDLRGMLEGEQFGEFAVMYRLLHRSRLPLSETDAHECWLEKYHQQGVESGGRVREGLRRGVEEALKQLGNGLLEHPRNEALRAKLAGNELSALDYYRTLLRLVYRLLFLMVAEERNLIAAQEAEDVFDPLYHRASADQRLRFYLDHYSLGRLRRLAEAPGAGRAPYDDLWLGLWTTFRLFEGNESARLLGIAPLGGGLFGIEALDALEGTQLRNDRLLAAIRALSTYQDPESRVHRRVNYAALDVEELGSVYESLLDYRPAISSPQRHGEHRESLVVDPQKNLRDLRAFVVHFDLVAGTERKTTGSYYTRPELVAELIKSALEPVIEDRLKGAATPETREAALLDLRVCDPACGSGHFLLAAARRIGRELARVRSGEDEPTPTEFRRAVRDAINRCVFGVDLNPLAVDLCKLALWIEGHNAGKPLSFLDAHVRRGNSLVGATRELVAQGIPDDAYKPVTGDDKAVAAAVRKRNQRERKEYLSGARQSTIFDSVDDGVEALAGAIERLEALPENSVAEVEQRARAYERARDTTIAEFARWDLWTAAFFQPLTAENERFVPSSADLLGRRDVRDAKVAAAVPVAQEVGFFHWELEFPQVFYRRGTEDAGEGFDAVLSNPPWEMLQLEELQFFSSRDREIANAPTKAARQKLISQLPQKNLKLAQEFADAVHTQDAFNRFVRESNRFTFTAIGKMNTYALFAEHSRSVLSGRGRAGIIVPTGIATDDTTKAFFSDLMGRHSLARIIGFENEAFIFSDVHNAFKFCALTMTGNVRRVERADFVFLCRYFEHVEQVERHFELSLEDLNLLNPNTRTCPIFRTTTDAELTKRIYRRVPVVTNEKLGNSPWSVSFRQGLFNMSSDSGLFYTREELLKLDCTLDGNTFVGRDNLFLPLYEAKMIWQYDHRFASLIGKENAGERPSRKYEGWYGADADNPGDLPLPTYWVRDQDVASRLDNRSSHNWLLGFRDITSSVVERTAIFSLLPRVAVGNKIPLIFLGNATPLHVTCFLACVNSLPFDYVARQKIAGTTMNFFIVKQLPVLPPSAFSADDIAYISERVLELVYTARDIQPFAADVWQELAEVGRQRVLNRNGECNRNAPADLFSPRDGLPLPPFHWNEERRAVIRAELDARIAHLYGLTRDELRYILDPKDVYGDDFPGETFRVLKEKELRQYGEYRTQRLVLDAWDREE